MAWSKPNECDITVMACGVTYEFPFTDSRRVKAQIRLHKKLCDECQANPDNIVAYSMAMEDHKHPCIVFHDTTGRGHDIRAPMTSDMITKGNFAHLREIGLDLTGTIQDNTFVVDTCDVSSR